VTSGVANRPDNLFVVEVQPLTPPKVSSRKFVVGWHSLIGAATLLLGPATLKGRSRPLLCNLSVIRMCETSE
jgi:hypothetical protein